MAGQSALSIFRGSLDGSAFLPRLQGRGSAPIWRVNESWSWQHEKTLGFDYFPDGLY